MKYLYKYQGQSKLLHFFFYDDIGDGMDKEYAINLAPKHGATRGKERMVIGSDGRSYYTKDHYKTFEEYKH